MIHVFFIWSKKLCPDTRCHLGCFVLGGIFPKPNVGVRVPCVGVFFRPFCCRRFAWRKTSKRWTGGTECVLFWKIHSLESTLAKITGFHGFVFHLLAAVWKNGGQVNSLNPQSPMIRVGMLPSIKHVWKVWGTLLKS